MSKKIHKKLAKAVATRVSPGILIVVVVVAIFSLLGAYSYMKENNCTIADSATFLSNATILCNNPAHQSPQHVCQPGVSCTY